MLSNVQKVIAFSENALTEFKSVNGKKFLVKENNILTEDGIHLVEFEVSKAGDSKYNAVSVIRDCHNVLNPENQMSRREIEKRIKIS